MSVRLNFRGVDFLLDDHKKYPQWSGATPVSLIQPDPEQLTWRIEHDLMVGVRYGGNWLRKRVLEEAAKSPTTEMGDDASIIFGVTVGFEYTILTGDGMYEGTVTCPQLYFRLGERIAFWKPYRSPGKSRIQKMLDTCTFGLDFESQIESCFEKMQASDTGDTLHLDQLPNELDLEEYLSNILRALWCPPPGAPAFPAPFQSYLIERSRRDYYDAEEFDFILDEAKELMAALGLDPDRKKFNWSVYPAAMAGELDQTSLTDLLSTAMSDDVDKFVAENTHFAPLVERYKKELLTPKTLMYCCVPVYWQAFASIDIVMRPHRTLGDRMTYEWSTHSDFDDEVLAVDSSADGVQIEAAIESVFGDVEDAVDYLMDHYAKEIEEHYDYLTSDEGVWEDIEACGDFDDDFSRYIHRD